MLHTSTASATRTTCARWTHTLSSSRSSSVSRGVLRLGGLRRRVARTSPSGRPISTCRSREASCGGSSTRRPNLPSRTSLCLASANEVRRTCVKSAKSSSSSSTSQSGRRCASFAMRTTRLRCESAATCASRSRRSRAIQMSSCQPIHCSRPSVTTCGAREARATTWCSSRLTTRAT